MSAPEKYLNSPTAENPVQVSVFFYSPTKEPTESCEIDASVFDAIKAGAARGGVSIGEFISQAVALKNQPAKVGKNFVAVNMSPDTQKKMRRLAKEVNWPWNSLLRWSLADAEEKLRVMVNCKRMTGLTIFELKLGGLSFQKRN